MSASNLKRDDCNAEILQQLDDLRSTPSKLWDVRICVCPPGTDCYHERFSRPNPRFQNILARVSELQELQFCGNCHVQRRGREWKLCLSCTNPDEQVWVKAIHNTPWCKGGSQTRYCSGCGQKN